MTSSSPGDVGWPARLVAAALALVGLLAALAVLASARNTASLEADVRTRAAAAVAAPAVASTLRTAVNEAASGGGTAQQRIPFAEAASRGVPVTTAVRARDTGRPLLDQSGVVVVATYGTPVPPASVAARRAAVTGLTVVPLDLDATLARLRPDEGGVLLRGPDEVVAEASDAPVEDMSTYRSPLAPTLAPGWSVTVWIPTPGVPARAWATAAALVLAGLAAAGALLYRERRAGRTRRELVQLREQSSTLSGLAAVAQQSLDLADVLPSVTTQLSTALDLRGLSLSAPTQHGERPFFSSGEPPGEPRPGGLPAGAEPGETVSIVLSRGGRTVAHLNVLAGRRLDSHDMVTLTGTAEILSSALANAEAFAQQRELLQRLRSLDELKTVFLATASHELRTPVGVISGFAQLLSRRVDELSPEQIRGFADRVDANAQQLSSLVENLLDFSRLERGVGGDDEQSVLDLGETVSRILDQQPDLVANHVVVRHTTAGLLVRGREHAVERVLTNLVGNAGKYSPVGTTIRVRVQAREGRAELLVDDEGPGVKADDREQIFSRFFRGRGDEVVNTRGAGLGLAIVREFAGSMGGQVSVTSAPSGGARFVVSYPLADPAQPSEGESDVAS